MVICFGIVADEQRNPDPPKPKRKRRKRAQPRNETVHYELKVTGWDRYYSFRISDPKSRWDPGPYSEISTLTFRGVVIHPGDSPYKDGELTLCAHAGLMEERREKPPFGIGSLSADGKILSAYVFIPVERLAELTALAISGRVQRATISGTRLRYRSGRVIGISVKTEIDEENDADA